MKKFLFIYALVFTFIWTGYGIYAVITDQPSAGLTLGFGLAFSIIIFTASWFSSWLMSHYKKIDTMAEKIIGKERKKRNA